MGAVGVVSDFPLFTRYTTVHYRLLLHHHHHKNKQWNITDYTYPLIARAAVADVATFCLGHVAGFGLRCGS
jgi:hypothetical protein